jgi:hypothetical protein
MRQNIKIYYQGSCGRLVKNIPNTIRCSDKLRKGYCLRGEREAVKPVLGEKCSFCCARELEQRKREWKHHASSRYQKDLEFTRQSAKDLDARHSSSTRDRDVRRELDRGRSNRMWESTKRVETEPWRPLFRASPHRHVFDASPKLMERANPVSWNSPHRGWIPSHQTRDARQSAWAMATGWKDDVMGRGRIGMDVGPDVAGHKVRFLREHERRRSSGKEFIVTDGVARRLSSTREVTSAGRYGSRAPVRYT